MSKKNEQESSIVIVNKIDEVVTSSVPTSQKIRFLLTSGFTRSQVALMLNIRYQHVRNVEITPIKKQS